MSTSSGCKATRCRGGCATPQLSNSSPCTNRFWMRYSRRDPDAARAAVETHHLEMKKHLDEALSHTRQRD